MAANQIKRLLASIPELGTDEPIDGSDAVDILVQIFEIVNKKENKAKPSIGPMTRILEKYSVKPTAGAYAALHEYARYQKENESL